MSWADRDDASDDLGFDDEDCDWCIDCGETFRYDDCGGYNPPCACGLHCRSCHDHADRDDDDADYYEHYEDETLPPISEAAPRD